MCSPKSWWPRESPIHLREWWHFGRGDRWLPKWHGSRSSNSYSVSPPSLSMEPPSRMFPTSPFLSLVLKLRLFFVCLFVLVDEITLLLALVYIVNVIVKIWFLLFLWSIIWRSSYINVTFNGNQILDRFLMRVVGTAELRR